jgi:hypothetical protein
MVLCSLVKQAGGVEGLCKRIVKDGGTDVGEAELVELITTTAKAAWPHLTPAAAFAKLFESPGGEMLRRAINVCKGAAYPATPRIGQTDAVGGQDALDTVGEDADESAALASVSLAH